MTPYSVKVTLDDETLDALADRFQMQVYKGVKTAAYKGGLPTVWYTVEEFSSTVTFEWSETYGGYFDNTQVIEGVRVNTSGHKSMKSGGVITLAEDGGSSVSTIGGVQDAFCFVSDMHTTWTSGLMVSPANESLAPVCAFPQYGSVANIIQPDNKLLVLFSQSLLDTGAVVETAMSTSVSIILTTSAPTIEMSFNINKGWDTQGKPQAKANPLNFELAPELIIPSHRLANISMEI